MAVLNKFEFEIMRKLSISHESMLTQDVLHLLLHFAGRFREYLKLKVFFDTFSMRLIMGI